MPELFLERRIQKNKHANNDNALREKSPALLILVQGKAACFIQVEPLASNQLICHSFVRRRYVSFQLVIKLIKLNL